MQGTSAASDPTRRLDRLLGFLAGDPHNRALLADAASAALDEGRLDAAAELIARYENAAPLPPPLQNIKGLISLNLGDYPAAEATFEPLVAENPGDPSLGFNLAWAKAMLADYAGALPLLIDPVLAANPAARALKIQMLHHLDQLDEALECGATLAELYPDDHALMGALATAAIDAENLPLAKSYAERAGAQPEGLAAMGMLLLDDNDASTAIDVFDRVLAQQPDNTRASLGKGLALLAQGKPQEGAQWLDKGAGGFEDHLGSWVAAGWAHFVQGDLTTSRARFETALGLDDTFAEIHGGLAVLDIAEGHLDSARHRTEVALRLDRRCFAGALAKMLLLRADGDPAAADRIRDIALNTPMGDSGKTIAQAMAGMAASPTKPRKT
jgi:tetratricopeptide (TPR) repeat protein